MATVITLYIGRRHIKHFVAAIDPYLAKGMEFRGKERFLNDPKTKEAVRIWKEYTDRLHGMRMDYDTYVMMDVDGKSTRVKASETYIENWIRRQLSQKAYKKLADPNTGTYNRELRRLIEKSEKKTPSEKLAEAQQIIGEWRRTSEYYDAPIRYGTADRPRVLDLSPELYETDFAVLAPGITKKYATFLAAAEVFDQSMRVRDQLVGRIQTEVGERYYREAGELVEIMIEGGRDRPSAFLMGASRGIAGMHLTGPKTFFNNTMYSHNADIAAFGFRAVGKAWMDFARNPITSIERARKAGQLGVGVREIESITFEKGAKGWLNWFPGGIVPSEIGNRARSVIGASHAADTYLRYLANEISPEVLRSIAPRKLKRARNFFREFGGFADAEITKMAERGYLTEKERNQIESFAPSVAQGATHPYFMPELMSGKWAPIGSLHKMAYRATGAVYKSSIKPLLMGDPGPMVKLLATGAIGGELSYLWNYAFYGWEHPQGGDYDDFIKYLQGPDADLDKAKALGMRIGSNILRAQSFGILTDWYQGYGFGPIIYDAHVNIYNDLYNVATGKKLAGDAVSDIMDAQVAIYRDYLRLKLAKFEERSKEYTNHTNVRRYVRNFLKDEKKEPQLEYGVQVLGQYSLAARHLKEAWWRETDPETFKRIIESSIKTYADKAEGMYQEIDEKNILPPEGIRKHAMKKGDKYVKGQIKSMHPLSGISGDLNVSLESLLNDKAVTWEGLLDAGRITKKEYKNKDTHGKIMKFKPKGDSDSPDAILFWNKLKDHEKRNIFNAVKDYVAILKELKLGGLYRK